MRIANGRSCAWVVAIGCLLIGSPGALAAGKSAAAQGNRKSAFVDELAQKAWDEASIKPSPVAPDSEFLRRAYLDLLGRIPNIEEASAFLNSKEAGKRTKLVEYLLDHPDFAKNFANQWMVILIGRQNQGQMVNRPALAAWLRLQFSNDRPWNEVVYDLVTAKGSNKENGAVNYALAHMEFGAVPLTSVTTRVFLGQQIQCTQCHNHPSNEWKQADFWGINAFFKGLKREDVRVANAAGTEVYDHTDLSDERTDAFSTFDVRDGRVGIAFPRYLDGKKVSQGKDIDRRVELGKLIADPKKTDPNLARAFVNRMWGHFMGRGIVHPVDDFGDHNPPSNPELLDRLSEEFRSSGYNVKELIRVIMGSRPYHLTSASTKSNEKDETLFSHMNLKPMTPEQLFDSLITATSAHKAAGGDTTQRRDAWMRQFLFTFGNDEGDEGTSFQGTIPQALMMMNGELMAQATGGKPGSFLADLCERAIKTNSPEYYMVNHLYLAALSRYPTRTELAQAAKVLSSFPAAETVPVLEDMFWALLNANEFILNH